jgi:hypothetical protein
MDLFDEFVNAFTKNRLLKLDNDTCMFNFKMSQKKIKNYQSEIEQHMNGKCMLWSKNPHFDKNKKKNNILFVIDNNGTDILLMHDTDEPPREHWEPCHYNNGIIRLELIGKLYLDIDIVWKKILGYEKNMSSRGKYQRICKDYSVIKKNIKEYFNLDINLRI